MDKRYTATRFYNGVKASSKGQEQADKLLRGYMKNVNAARRKSEDYGGSTGGVKSIGSNDGLQVIKQRSARQADLRRIFQDEGVGRFGARKEAWIAKQFDPEVKQKMIDIQSGLEQEDL